MYLVTLDFFKFKKTDQFKFLLINITKDNEEGSDIQSRLAAATDRSYCGLIKLFKIKLLSKNGKVRIYSIIGFAVWLRGLSISKQFSKTLSKIKSYG